jgi:hypothetical protein
VRFPHSLALILLAFGCGHERFDLLPPPDDVPDGGTENGGTSAGGLASGGTGAQPATGGQSGRDAGPAPIPDCPDKQPDCLPCESFRCPPTLWCDVIRNYCAPYCGMGFECKDRDLPACDFSRSVCVECTNPGHCDPGLDLACVSFKCVPKAPPQCVDFSQCDNPDKPVCFEGRCYPCSADWQCEDIEGMGSDCNAFGRCVPGMQKP